MYAYSHDAETGGLFLSDTPSSFSKEPRPVYSRELDLLGFDQFWIYERQDERPYFWAEANFYWYRGKRVARTTGGNLFERPQIILEENEDGFPLLPQGTKLNPVDIDSMVRKNIDLLDVLEKSTEQKIYAVYKQYKKRFDCFRVAFSGGKDSIILLELVKNSIPPSSIIVLFGDTGMEFPDTYSLINSIELKCQKEGIAFYRAHSSFNAEDTWKIFGPPSRILRWCCSVHKAVPQMLKMRSIMRSIEFKEFVFIGVRAYESDIRAKYTFISKNKKIKGQVSCNAILNWSSAEVWLYIYWKKLFINNAYKIGNQRVGCLYCPMSLKSDYIKNKSYPNEIKPFLDITLANYEKSDLTNGYWCSRVNGSQLKINKQKIFEIYNKNEYIINVNNPTTDINIWLKILPQISFPYFHIQTENGFQVHIPQQFLQSERIQISLFKNLIYKSAYCIECGLCEANCPHGCISFSGGLHIDKCVHCQSCNKIENGCILYNSRKFPSLRGVSQMKPSVDCFGTHAPKTKWFIEFFKAPNEFFKNNNLGPEQISRFRRFLKAADLLNSSGITSFAQKIRVLQWDSEISLSLMLIKLAENNQIKWYIKNLPLNENLNRKEAYELMISQGYKQIASKNVISALKRISELPFGTKIHFCKTITKGKNLEIVQRTTPIPPAPHVFLYGLYTFAEACNGYYEFTLSRLMDFSIESAGVSPAEIFGLSRAETEQYLHGLAHSNPEFISFSTTHGLEIVRLADEKKSEDVLSLF